MAMYYTPIPHDFLEEMGELSDAEYGRLIRWCQTYSITGEETELSGNERFFRMRCKKQIDAAKSNYEAKCEKNRTNGAKGGRPRKNPEKPTETQNNPEEPNKNINKNNKEKDDAKASSKKKAVITAWNDAVANSIVPELKVLNDDSTRYRMLNARIKEYGLEQVLEAIKNVGESSFLRSSPWFSFGWFVKPNNFIKVYEGNYRDEEPKESQKSTHESGSWEDIAQALDNRT